MAALAMLGLSGCSNSGAEAVEALRADPLADARFEGVSQVGETVTSEGSSGAAGSPATLRRDLRSDGADLGAAAAVVAEVARSEGWDVQPGADGLPGAYSGTKRVDGRVLSLAVTPVPDNGGGYGSEFQLELSTRWSG